MSSLSWNSKPSGPKIVSSIFSDKIVAEISAVRHNDKEHIMFIFYTGFVTFEARFATRVSFLVFFWRLQIDHFKLIGTMHFVHQSLVALCVSVIKYGKQYDKCCVVSQDAPHCHALKSKCVWCLRHCLYFTIAEGLVCNHHQLNVLSNDREVSQPRQGQAQLQWVSSFRLDSGLKCTIAEIQMNCWLYLDKPIAEETVPALNVST